jgi:hypothetical protein
MNVLPMQDVDLKMEKKETGLLSAFQVSWHLLKQMPEI